MNDEMVVYEAQHQTEIYKMSTTAANLCREIVVASAQDIAGKKYVKVEGWQAIAIAHGCTASSGEVEQIETGLRAIGKVIRMSDGMVLSQAEGFVGNDESMWASRPEYARRAMAQTRAISRACRSAFAHVVVMMNAGLSTTPAEEVPSEGFSDKPAKPPIQKPQSTAAVVDGDKVTGTIEQVSIKKGKNKSGDWTKYGILIDGEWYSTFSNTVGELAQSLKGSEATITYAIDGNFKNALEIEPAGGADAAEHIDCPKDHNACMKVVYNEDGMAMCGDLVCDFQN